jgi:hypothetical protein
MVRASRREGGIVLLLAAVLAVFVGHTSACNFLEVSGVADPSKKSYKVMGIYRMLAKKLSGHATYMQTSSAARKISSSSVYFLFYKEGQWVISSQLGLHPYSMTAASTAASPQSVAAHNWQVRVSTLVQTCCF